MTPDIEPAGPLGVAPRIRFELSPINIRRWYNFKANRRGYWSLWFFLVLFVLTLFAEFIANDKPLFIHYDGKNYFPVIFTYPDTEFGDDLGTAADYRDPHLQSLPQRASRHRDLAADQVLLQDHQRRIRRRHFRRSRPGC